MDGPLYADIDVQPAAGDWLVKKDRFSPFAPGGRHQSRTAAEGPKGPEQRSADGGGIGSTSFEERLRQRGVETVLIAGCTTNICCESTARDAMQRNFGVVVLADACAARLGG